MAAPKGPGSAVGPVAEFCADLNQLRISSGRDYRTLARELNMGKSQLYTILTGKRKTPPDWQGFVRPLVKVCTNGDTRAETAWRRRHEILVGVYEELNRRQKQTPPAADPGPAEPAGGTAIPPLNAAAATEPEETVPQQVPEPRTPDVDRLAEIVLKEWMEEYDARKFNDTGYELKVSWKAAASRLMSSWEKLIERAVRGTRTQKGVRSDVWAGNAHELGGSDHELPAVLDRVPTGWLVVLGEPGYGKSMLMLQLVIDLIMQRDSGAPVPVFVPMTTWDPEADELEKWLEKQLPHDYPILDASVPSAEGRRSWIADLLATQKIVPILDGLDEMPLVLRRRAVDRLNKSFTSPDRPLHLVMTCRTAEYRDIVSKPWNPVLGAAAIELQPPDEAEVAHYLSSDGNDDRWAGVVQELCDLTVASPLREALATPLYACLASAIYNPHRHMRGNAPDPEDLCTKFHDAASIRYHLLDEFIPSMYPDEREAEERRAREEKRQAGLLPVERRLMFIARYLEKRKSTTLEWWNLEGLAPKWLPAVVVGVVSGIAVGVAAALGTHVGVGIGVGFGTGMLIAVAIGLGFRHARERWDKEGFERRFATRRPGPGMAGGIIGAVLGGLAAGVAGRYHIGHEASLFSGIPEALGIAIGAGATTDFLGGLVGTLIGSFVAGYLAAVGLGLPAGIVDGLGAGIAAALAIKYLGRRIPSIGAPVWEPQIGIPAGLIVGLVIGLIAWREVGVIGGIVVGLLIAAAASVPLGMRYSNQELDAAPSPGQALARDASAFRLTALWAGLATGSVAFIGGAMTSIFEVGAKPHLTDIIRDGLGIGLSAGLVVGLCFGFYHAASPDFRILNWWLACQRKVPFRFRRFLDDAHQRTVLRQAGASYEFRHVILRDRLAARLEAITSSKK
jgi:NACHT domain